MVYGWIGRKEYLAHHDPQRWVVAQKAPRSFASVDTSASANPSTQHQNQPVS
jgi:hypothetical protein